MLNELPSFASSGPTLLAELLLIYTGSLIVYRLFLHPLQNFPGDKLAALTEWHWDYHASTADYLERVHNKYGPVVRIGPNSLHFSDPKAYSAIYAPGSKFTKDPNYYAAFDEAESSFGLTDPASAKVRRDIISPLFSRRAIIKLENVIQDKVDILISQVISQKDRPIDLYYAFRSTTLDIITSYCFAKSWTTLTYPCFQHPLLLGMDEALPIVWCLHAFPVLRWLLPLMEPLVARTNPNMKAFLQVRVRMESQIDELLKDPGLLDRADHEIVYHHLLTLQPGKGQHQIPSRTSLWHESINFIFAGSDTVAKATSVGTFHVLNNKWIGARLIQELQQAWPDIDGKVGYEALEKLPYLTAIIKESLRMSLGVVSPMPRIVGPSSAIVAGVNVPMGTSVSICTNFLHHNEKIFSDPMTFTPERWLELNSHELDNHMVSFSRGPRSCIGINLAWCELYLIFGNVFRKLDMQLYETSVDDFRYKAYFQPVFTGRHLQALVKERNT